ncbi:MAG: flagellar biosynthetic protein FliR [Actinobacteria bacterium]|nr:flagellar biosynthetic protein FliR [Actinomycetota bacterium]
MLVSLDGSDLVAFFLALARTGAFVSVAPPFSTRGVIPYPARIILAAGLALPAVPVVATQAVPTTTPALIGDMGIQALSGFILGFIVLLLFSAFSTAGALADLFGGITLPPSLDPLSQDQVPVIGQLYEQVALALLFVTNGELLILRGLLASFRVVGVGLAQSGGVAHIFSDGLETLFVAALEIAAPLLMVLFAAQVVLALLAKAAPQMNVFMLGFPLQVLATILMLALAMRVMGSSVDHVVEHLMVDMGRILRLG